MITQQKDYDRAYKVNGKVGTCRSDNISWFTGGGFAEQAKSCYSFVLERPSVSPVLQAGP